MVGASDDWLSRGYSIISTLFLIVNLAVTILYTFNEMEYRYGSLMLLEGDHIILYNQERILGANIIQL